MQTGHPYYTSNTVLLTFGHPDGEKRAYTVLNTQNDIKEGTFES